MQVSEEESKESLTDSKTHEAIMKQNSMDEAEDNF